MVPPRKSAVPDMTADSASRVTVSPAARRKSSLPLPWTVAFVQVPGFWKLSVPVWMSISPWLLPVPSTLKSVWMVTVPVDVDLRKVPKLLKTELAPVPLVRVRVPVTIAVPSGWSCI